MLSVLYVTTARIRLTVAVAVIAPRQHDSTDLDAPGREVEIAATPFVRAAGAHSPATSVATIVVLESPNHSLAIDPNAIGRVMQGILTGIGFLGAGVILRDPKGHVTGLTTATTIWICAILGIVCGLGYWSILASLLVLPRLPCSLANGWSVS